MAMQANTLAGHALKYEKVKADRRGDLRHLDDDDQEHAKPNLINLAARTSGSVIAGS